MALHGNGGGAFRFARVTPYLPVEVYFRPITLPGFDKIPRDPNLRSLHDYAIYCRDRLAVESRPLVLLGHGIGGSILLELAQHYAGEIDGLILHAPVGTRLDTRFFPRLMRLPKARDLGRWLFASRLARSLLKPLLFSQPIPADYLDHFFDAYRRCLVFSQMFDLITPAWFNSLQPVGLPAALLWGERERVLGVDQLSDYQQLLPRHIARAVPDWDHFPMIEQPAAYAAEIVGLAQALIKQK